MNTVLTLPVLSALPALLATADRPGWGWAPGPWFLLFPLLFWTTVIVLGIAVLRRRGRDRSGESTLADVFARGEITEAEYRARLAVLRENRR
jgi:putative membrane protein